MPKPKLKHYKTNTTMPGQRNSDKRGMSVYVPSDIKDAIEAESKKQGVPMSVLVTRFYRSKLRSLGYSIADEVEEEK